MEHQRQGKFECFPTTVAMLIGEDKDRIVREAICGVGLPPGTSWAEAVNSQHCSRLFRYVREHFASWIPVEMLMLGAGQLGGIEEPDLTGKGTLFWLSPSATSRHATAFEDGLVFDPLEEGPAPFKDCRMVQKGWKLESVNRKPAEPR
ncbi:MAG: hypothetical protein ACRD2L_25375 [Terriglobia bacterium]